MSKPALTCYGGVGAVTGANFLLETGSKKCLIDCGLLQGVHGADEVNASKFDYDPTLIDLLFITHAHIDHIGKIPKLVKDGFKGIIYSTPETKAIAELMLMDTAKITEGNARREGTLPLYTAHDVDRTMHMWRPIEYHAKQDFEGFSVELFDAGHILGSAMYKFTFSSGRSILFTGDLGNSPSALLRDTENVSGLDYLLMDSVYGDRNHEDKAVRDQKFKDVLRRVIEKKGTLLIPVFSLERTQVLLYKLNELFESKEIPTVPVFLDSPLAIRVTQIYERVSKEYKPSVQADIKAGDDIFVFPKLRSIAQARESHELVRIPGPKIIMAGSGMSTAGRIVNHEMTFLPDPNATLLLVGYQAVGTLGRIIEEGGKEVFIKGERIPLRAHVEKIDGFSAHKDSNGLVEFASHTAETVKKVFVAMGEPRAAAFLCQRLHDELGVTAVQPERGKHYELDL
ncbi:MAG: RNA-metabolising metallo-beta-lactamase, metallo-beta-lactamase family protein [Parcubacteria group bacterium]|nr:RNA-metabolising metallo-beta-lactamase, metallo-beta-lactamase family protein [Parcubacteria group bacterium]